MKFTIGILSIFIILGGCDSRNLSKKLNYKVDYDLSYDSLSLTKFDFFAPKATTGKLPLIIFIHGGSFTGGDKNRLLLDDILSKGLEDLINEGFAVAAINYPLLSSKSNGGVLVVLQHIKKFIQYIRCHSDAFNIDKERIGIWGSSAGASAGLWIGLQNDLKMVGSFDCMLSQSTRIKAIACYATQATLNLGQWPKVVFGDLTITQNDIIQLVGEDKICKFYDLETVDDFDAFASLEYRKSTDIIEFITSDDPPIWIHNPNPTVKTMNLNINQLYHHYLHCLPINWTIIQWRKFA